MRVATEPQMTSGASDLVSPWLARNAICLLGFLGLALFGVLYLARPDAYLKLIAFWFYFDNPKDPPFTDLGAVMAQIECWQKAQGTPAAGTACAGFMYSPIWLRFSFMAQDAVPPIFAGLLVVSAFFISWRALPPARDRFGLVLMILAATSSTCVFAVERANVDVLLFVLAVAAALSLGAPWPRRAWAYALMLLGGLLKFYPIVLLFAVLRERLPRLIAVSALVVLSLAAFFWHYRAEFSPVVQGVAGLNTHWGPFADRYSARQLPAGLLLLATSDAPPTAIELLPGTDTINPEPPLWSLVVLTLLALAVALWQLRRGDIRVRWQALTPREADFLILGAVIVAGCFFAGYNIMYRGIFLLLALPGLITMAGSRQAGLPSLFVRGLPIAVVYNMWAPTIQHLIHYLAKVTGWLATGRTVQFTDWLLHEVAWWWTITGFLALMLNYAWQSPALQSLLPALRGRPGAPQTP